MSFILSEQRRRTKRLYSTFLLAALIAVLLYETEWLNLRFGLVVLLAGQVVDAAALIGRNLLAAKQEDFSEWVDSEKIFVPRLALFDFAFQMIGFVALGYAFWISTGSLWLALGIGLIYPVTLYFGLTRRRVRETIRRLLAEQARTLEYTK